MGNPFASQSVSEPIPLPFDEGQWVQVRKLTGREVEAAQFAHLTSMVAGRSARGWSGAFQRIIAGVATAADAAHALADPLAGYDRTVLVRAGLVAWSYPQSLTPVLAKPTSQYATPTVVSDAIEDLVDEALEFIAGAILKRTKPALFYATEEDASAAQKELSAAASPA